MRDKQTRKFNKKLLSQLGALIIILFIITIVINGYSIYHGSSYRFQQRQQTTAETILSNLQDSFNHNYDEDSKVSFKWFVDFWHDHYEDMNISAYTFDELWVRAQAICSRYDCYMPTSLSPETIDSLTYEEQLDLARYEYTVDNSIYNSDWSYEGMDVAGYILRAFILDENDQGFVIFESDPDYDVNAHLDNSDTPVYSLGKTIHFDLNQHPYARKALETKQFQTTPEQEFFLKDRKAALNYYMPIVDNGNAIGLIQLSLDWTENARVIWRNSAQVELVNLIVHLLVAVLILYGVYRLAVRPLKTVQHNVRDYKEDKDSEAIVKKTGELKYSNEFGLLADDVADLAVEMTRYTEEVGRLSGEQERKNAELSIARNIQMQNLPNVFPAFPDRDDFDIYASMAPALEVGGDFYDYFLIDDDHLALVIADVSDKGVPAALFMMMAKSRLNSVAMAERDFSPARILRETNDILCNNNDSSMFVTVWFGILTLSTGELVTSNGGHEDPFIKTNGSFALCQEDHCLALGLFPGMEYTEQRYSLNKGDMIYVYTDGVAEAFNDAGEQFGTHGIQKALDTDSDRKLDEVLSAISGSVYVHTAEKGSHDDMTMLVLRLT